MRKKLKNFLKTTAAGLVFGVLLYSALLAMVAVSSGARVFRYQGF